LGSLEDDESYPLDTVLGSSTSTFEFDGHGDSKILPQESESQNLFQSLTLSIGTLEGVTHKGHSVLSLDFAAQLDPVRLVTASQDGSVKVWGLDMAERSGDKAAPKCTCLSTMEEHLAPVNCIRWSADSLFIASGDAEAALIVWMRGSNAARWGKAKDLEPWRRKWTLTGHEGEVCDLAWHPWMHPRFNLASGSSDGSVRLWNVHRGEVTAVLRSADAISIKGVAFDPLGQFLAAMADVSNSSSSERALLWESPDDSSTSARQQWSAVPLATQAWSKPRFLEVSMLCLSRRPSWDPLGQSIVFPFGDFARNENSTPKYFGVLFERNCWKTPMRYRGHEQMISTVRFSPIVFGESGDQKLATMMCALASTNGVLSIWSLDRAWPLFTGVGLVTGQDFITDMCWLHDGNVLAFSCNSGAICFLALSSAGAFSKHRWSKAQMQRWRRHRYLELEQPQNMFYEMVVDGEHTTPVADDIRKRKQWSSTALDPAEVSFDSLPTWEDEICNVGEESSVSERPSKRLQQTQLKHLSVVVGHERIELQVEQK
jgi:WD40 repeat protein